MITTTALTKSYDQVPVVRDVSLRCEPGTITGFLGANGAGKSTTLKMIVGLVRPDRGTATIDGRPFVELPNPTRVVGTLLDASAMHPGRSGRATLTIAARMAGVHTTAGRAPVGPRRAHRCGGQAGRDLLARHAPAPRHRPGPRR